MRVLVWNEHLHEQKNPKVAAVYPQGMHQTLAAALEAGVPDITCGTATLADADQGITAASLAAVDVLLWWGHLAHHQVDDGVVELIYQRVLAGMGLVVLHSAHLSKIFRRLMGTSCNLRWREAEDRELLWTVAPSHPNAQGVPQPLVLGEHEMYGEYFDIPAPDELIFISSFSGGEVFRSGATFRRGLGRVFYFSPGHETYPIYHNADVQRVLCNAVRWVYQSPHTLAPLDLSSSPQSPTGWFEAGAER